MLQEGRINLDMLDEELVQTHLELEGDAVDPDHDGAL